MFVSLKLSLAANTSYFSYIPTSYFQPGGDERDRTADPLLAKQVLSQLSYTPALLESKRWELRKQELLLSFTPSAYLQRVCTLKIKQRLRLAHSPMTDRILRQLSLT